MVETFKKFLWGGAKQVKKWALVSCLNLKKPKMEGDWVSGNPTF